MATNIMLLGETQGAHEERIKASFVGPAGAELLRMLDMAGVISLTQHDRSLLQTFYDRADPHNLRLIWDNHPNIYRTNVFQKNPPGGRLEWFCGPRADGVPNYSSLVTGGYVRREFALELERLAEEIETRKPNVIVCLGNTALWAMTGRSSVRAIRGTTLLSTHCVPGVKILPTYHPAVVQREWAQRPVVIMDLKKAQREACTPKLVRPDCELWLEPELFDIRMFFTSFVQPHNFPTGEIPLAVDIETEGKYVTCIGFAVQGRRALVIPFDGPNDKHYWPTLQDEQAAWRAIIPVLENPYIPKVFQNGLYDIAFLLRSYGIRVFGAQHDTMLLSHSLQPECLKGLGFLGSIYSDFGAWKAAHKEATIKRDD